MMYRELQITVLLLCANAALTQECRMGEVLEVDAGEKRFDIENDDSMIGKDYTCYWEIQKAHGRSGTILIKVVGLPGGEADNECIYVSTERPTPENQNKVKVCATKETMNYETETSPVYVSYPVTNPGKDIKGFAFSYVLTNAQLAGKCKTPAPLTADEQEKTITIGHPSIPIGKEYECEWQIKTAAGITGEIMISVTASSDAEATKQCIGVTTEAAGTPNRKIAKVCGKEKHTVNQVPVYLVYPADKSPEVTTFFSVSYQLTKSQLTGECQKPNVLLASSEKMEFNIGDGKHELGTNYKCEWQVKPADGQSGDIVVSVVKSNDGDATTQCVDVTTEPPAVTNTNGQASGTAQRNTIKLCAGGSDSSFRSRAPSVNVLYPANGNTKVNKPFKVSYQLTNEPLSGKCPKPDVLTADTELKTFFIGNGKHDLAADYQCEWEIKTVEGKTGTIELSVNKSTDGEAANQCVDVTTVAANSANANGQTAQRNQTKLCADGTGSPYTTSTSPVFVIYPASGNTKSNKPFYVAYKLNSSLQLSPNWSYVLFLILSLQIFCS